MSRTFRSRLWYAWRALRGLDDIPGLLGEVMAGRALLQQRETSEKELAAEADARFREASKTVEQIFKNRALALKMSYDQKASQLWNDAVRYRFLRKSGVTIPALTKRKLKAGDELDALLSLHVNLTDVPTFEIEPPRMATPLEKLAAYARGDHDKKPS
jgi:hypothetical protein